MRWSIIRLIWFRELRDQLRDRRTLFMIAVLPILLYPVGGIGLMQLASGYLGKKNIILIVGHQYLPPSPPAFSATDDKMPLLAAEATTWFAAIPAGPGSALAGVERLGCAFSLAAASQLQMPPL